jgi:hypothetical protein
MYAGVEVVNTAGFALGVEGFHEIVVGRIQKGQNKAGTKINIPRNLVFTYVVRTASIYVVIIVETSTEKASGLNPPHLPENSFSLSYPGMKFCTRQCSFISGYETTNFVSIYELGIKFNIWVCTKQQSLVQDS